MGNNEFIKALDEASLEVLSEKRRKHLGPSVVSTRCARKAWYEFRWVLDVKFTGRIKRLFNRGHEEEDRVVRWLRAAGAEVRDYAERLIFDPTMTHDDILCPYYVQPWDDPIHASHDDVHDDPHHLAMAKKWDTKGFSCAPKQWGFKIDVGQEPRPIFDHRGLPAGYADKGHYSGSGDGMVRGIERWFPEVAGLGWGLFENKTHNLKSFTDLKKKGVLSSKPEHYVQMQQYMHFFGLKWGLYIGSCKDDDHLYSEIIMYKPEMGIFYPERAMQIIDQNEAPARLTEDPSWFECRFCDYREICHYGKTPEKNCRSCVYASAVAGANWFCSRHHGQIPPDFVAEGCGDWEPVK
jgi:hypothetical protein